MRGAITSPAKSILHLPAANKKARNALRLEHADATEAGASLRPRACTNASTSQRRTPPTVRRRLLSMRKNAVATLVSNCELRIATPRWRSRYATNSATTGPRGRSGRGGRHDGSCCPIPTMAWATARTAVVGTLPPTLPRFAKNSRAFASVRQSPRHMPLSRHAPTYRFAQRRYR
jgi:hypothetical protein